MRRLFAILLLLSAWASATNTTGTVTDPNGYPYANGTVSAVLTTSGPPSVGGVPLLPYQIGIGPYPTDASGTFSINLIDTSTILPVGSQWVVTVCAPSIAVPPSVPSSRVCFTAPPLAITGGSVDISTQLSIVAPNIGPVLPSALVSTYDCRKASGSGVTKLANCITNASAARMMADARGINGTISFTGGVDIWAGATNPVVIITGPQTTWSCSQQINASPGPTSACIVMRSRTGIVGPGPHGGFVIKLANNQPDFSRLIETTNGASGVWISGVEFDGNKANNTGASVQDHAIELNATVNSTFRDLYIHDPYGDMILLESAAGGLHTQYNTFTSIEFGDAQRGSISIIDGSNNNFTDIRQFAKTTPFGFIHWEADSVGQLGNNNQFTNIQCVDPNFNGACDLSIGVIIGNESAGQFSHNRFNNVVLAGGALVNIQSADNEFNNLTIIDPRSIGILLEGPNNSFNNLKIYGGPHRSTSAAADLAGIEMYARYAQNYTAGYCGNKFTNVDIFNVAGLGLEIRNTYFNNCTHNQFRNVNIHNIHNVLGVQYGFGITNTGDYAEFNGVRVWNDPGYTFATLPATWYGSNSYTVSCSDCTAANPTAGGGAGRTVIWTGTQWNGSGAGTSAPIGPYNDYNFATLPATWITGMSVSCSDCTAANPTAGGGAGRRVVWSGTEWDGGVAGAGAPDAAMTIAFNFTGIHTQFNHNTPHGTFAGGAYSVGGASFDSTIGNPGLTNLLTNSLSAPNYTSTVAIGTQPYATTSNTLNTNLNADMVDGFHASATPGVNTVAVTGAGGGLANGFINWGSPNSIGTTTAAAGSFTTLTASQIGITGGVTSSGGVKHQRFVGVLGGTCPTAAAIGAACTSANLNWATAYSDTNYTVTCSLVGNMTGQPHIVNLTKAAGSITVTIAADTAAAANIAAAGELDCIAFHD